MHSPRELLPARRLAVDSAPSRAKNTSVAGAKRAGPTILESLRLRTTSEPRRPIRTKPRIADWDRKTQLQPRRFPQRSSTIFAQEESARAGSPATRSMPDAPPAPPRPARALRKCRKMIRAHVASEDWPRHSSTGRALHSCQTPSSAGRRRRCRPSGPAIRAVAETHTARESE